jgi:nonsense-mediated mRNA decay protein 3
MLAFLLKQIKGLNKQVKLVDVGFIWTEPHSKRIKLKAEVKREVLN